jgi:hypothetical protein
MKRIFVTLLFLASLVVLSNTVQAQDTLIPAGTLIRCTLDEPNFSSATASVGDPVVCHLSSLQMYGRNVFPRGSYLGGHLEAAKEPGHFFGKGYLQLQFDRIGFPSSDIPVPSKVIAAKGYKVDKQGDIKGKGHATRDVVEWMIPPLWPWKIITLPARGPRPTLKGEEQITLRLMDDIVVPPTVASNRPPYYRPQPSSYDHLPPSYRSNRPPQSGYPVGAVPATTDQENAAVASVISSDTAVVTNANVESQTAQPVLATPATLESRAVPASPASDEAQHLTLIALKSGNLVAVASYRVDGGILNYVTAGGTESSADAQAIDWRRTSQLNIRHAEASVATPVPHAY